jgi:hypothetical protein
MSKRKKIMSFIPFLLVGVLMLFAWFEILTTEYIATWRHYVGLVLVGGNVVLYFIRYKQAIVLTGIILILATFNLLSFFTITPTSYLTVKGISTPEIQLKSLLLLIIYGVVNTELLMNWYLDMKENEGKEAFRK